MYNHKQMYCTWAKPQINAHADLSSGKRRSTGLCALRGYFGPPVRPKLKVAFLPVSFYWFIRTIAKVLKSGINLTLTIAIVTKMAAKIGLK